MNIGKLRRRVKIYDKGTVTRNGPGEEIPAYDALVATVWAAVEPMSGREFIEATQVQADVTIRIRIRYRNDIRPEMRVVEGTHTYHIESALDQFGEHRETWLMCHEVL
ncbi:head-tail adaptor protein [Chloroflexi bacterium CFX6]|nr:head-tail adaptor protein [Chloroflexi bacterium CFX6]